MRANPLACVSETMCAIHAGTVNASSNRPIRSGVCRGGVPDRASSAFPDARSWGVTVSKRSLRAVTWIVRKQTRVVAKHFIADGIPPIT